MAMKRAIVIAVGVFLMLAGLYISVYGLILAASKGHDPFNACSYRAAPIGVISDNPIAYGYEEVFPRVGLYCGWNMADGSTVTRFTDDSTATTLTYGGFALFLSSFVATAVVPFTLRSKKPASNSALGG
jgi:hypothetical protein